MRISASNACIITYVAHVQKHAPSGFDTLHYVGIQAVVFRSNVSDQLITIATILLYSILYTSTRSSSGIFFYAYVGYCLRTTCSSSALIARCIWAVFFCSPLFCRQYYNAARRYISYTDIVQLFVSRMEILLYYTGSPNEIPVPRYFANTNTLP